MLNSSCMGSSIKKINFLNLISSVIIMIFVVFALFVVFFNYYINCCTFFNELNDNCMAMPLFFISTGQESKKEQDTSYEQ